MVEKTNYLNPGSDGELWFAYILPEEISDEDWPVRLESDGPDAIPVLVGEPMCSIGVWMKSPDTMVQAGQAGWSKKDSAMDSVLTFCRFVCEGQGATRFYIWDDAEGAWWSEYRAEGGSWVQDDNEGNPWTVEDLI